MNFAGLTIFLFLLPLHCCGPSWQVVCLRKEMARVNERLLPGLLAYKIISRGDPVEKAV